ncbi:membrane-spanning 4-domains subfamily A member 4D-like isoform X1 [Nannospalax galili]|uniref:membrane-spanning 4-domains subfamily A member 4D-like isoform X1 n=1 Tax=Nannospalax galili TaxID=1026970 RepID=UPI00111BFBED|nr:membrane-spanning 4-domains subfamily A member 4D-like isoform X1 [Nannospalax galili]
MHVDHQARDLAIHQGHPEPVILSQKTRSNLQSFIKGEPVLFGVSQILIGMMNISLWLMLKASNYFPDQFLPFLGGVEFQYLFLLGPIFYVVSGTLSIVTRKNITKSMIYGSLGMNSVCAVLAGASLFALLVPFGSCSGCGTLSFYIRRGILIVSCILTLLEFCIAVSLSAFGCNAVCCDVTTVVVNISSNEQELSLHAGDHVYDEVAFPPT